MAIEPYPLDPIIDPVTNLVSVSWQRWFEQVATNVIPGAVGSVFGRSGDVVAVTNDYTWAQIDKSSSDITDITTRSHTDLTDIGSNTHPQIDTHIANTTNPHSTDFLSLIDTPSSGLRGQVLKWDNAETALEFLTESINVKSYGVTGDGVTDDATNINTVLTSEASIEFPVGTYLVSGNTIHADATTKYIFSQQGAIIKLDTSGSSEIILTIDSDVEDLVIEGITFDVNQPGSITDICIQVNGAKNITFRKNKFINSAVATGYPNTAFGYGVYLAGSFENINFFDNEFFGVMWGILTFPTSTGRKVKVIGNNFEELAGDGVTINIPTNGSFDDLVVIGNTFKSIGSGTAVNRGFGVGTSAQNSSSRVTNVTIVGNYFELVDYHGVHIEDNSSDITISGNTFVDCGFSAEATFSTTASIAVTSANVGQEVKNVIVSNNIIRNTDSTIDYGILFSGTQRNDGFIINNNTLHMNGTAPGIFAFGENFSINNNIVDGSDGAGIDVRARQGIVSGNNCYDSQGTKTQTYGIAYNSNADDVNFTNNTLLNNINAGFNEISAPTNIKFLNNITTVNDYIELGGSTHAPLMPSLTTTERNALTPVNGMIIYNTTTIQMESYESGAWGAMGGGTGDLLADGTVPLTADWDAGSFKITAETFESDIVTGTAPFTVASQTKVTNLHADLLDGHGEGAFALLAGRSGGQTLIGGSGTGEDLTLESNSSNDGSVLIGTNWKVDEATGHMGIIGAPLTTQAFNLTKTHTSTASNLGGGLVIAIYNPGSATSRTFTGFNLFAESQNGNAQNFTGAIQGFQGTAQHKGTATAVDVRGASMALHNTNTGTITEGRIMNIGGATNSGGGTITTLKGLHIADVTAGSTNWSIYSEGGASYHEGELNIGTIITGGAKLRVDQSSLTGGVPAVYVDQADLDQDCIETVFANSFTGSLINVTGSNDQDINIVNLSGITGTPLFSWNESEDSFSFTHGSIFDSAYIGDGAINNFAWFSHVDMNGGTGDYALLQQNDGTTFLNCSASKHIFFRINNATKMTLDSNGTFGIGVATPLGQVHVDQASTTGAMPVVYFNQADVSEEIIEIVSTAGIGNAIELVGAKTFTLTEFVKCTINGNTRYLQAGTIS